MAVKAVTSKYLQTGYFAGPDPWTSPGQGNFAGQWVPEFALWGTFGDKLGYTVLQPGFAAGRLSKGETYFG